MSFFDLLKHALQNLPGQDAQYQMAPTQRHRISIHQFEKLEAKKGAVLINLIEEKGNIFTYLMKRTDDLGPHGGQISFPGGKHEKDDESLAITAIRENEEEIGISREKVSLLGELTPLYIPVSNFLVYPFISKTDLEHETLESKHEVAELLKVNVKELLTNDDFKDKIWMETSYGKMQMPCYKFQNHIIWGATAMILSELEVIIKSI